MSALAFLILLPSFSALASDTASFGDATEAGFQPVQTAQDSSILPAEPLGTPVMDPLATDSGLPIPREGDAIDTIISVRHGAMEGTRVITAGDSIAYAVAEWMRDRVLHSRTREGTISRRLLFKVGDPIDSLRLAETERSLRAERFIAEASVRTRTLPDGKRAVEVETWDQWSTAIPLAVNRAGGELSWLVGFNESNLLGTGQTVGFSYLSKPLQTAWNFSYANNAFLLPGHLLSIYWSNTSDGDAATVRLGRPLDSRYQDWAWMLEYDEATSERSVWADVGLWKELRRGHPAQKASDWKGGRSGESVGALDAESIDEYASFGQLAWYDGTHTQKVRLWAQRVWGSDLRVSTGPLLESQRDSAGTLYVSSALPASLREEITTGERWASLREGSPEVDDRRVGWMGSIRRDRWIRRKNFNNLKWVEDIPVGWLVEASTVRSVVSRGEDRDATWNQVSGRWSGLADRTYAVASASWIGRTGGESRYENRQGLAWKAELRRMSSPQFQTLLTASGDFVADAPPTSQLTLGEENGLPGFPAHSFVGSTRNVFGSELRWAPPLEAFTVVPALAAFAAAGRVGDEIRPLGSGEWHYGAGVGLRFGLTRSINGIVNHISISRPLGPEGGDWTETSSWMLSFGTRQSL